MHREQEHCCLARLGLLPASFDHPGSSESSRVQCSMKNPAMQVVAIRNISILCSSLMLSVVISETGFISCLYLRV